MTQRETFVATAVRNAVKPTIREYEASDGYVFKYRHWSPALDPPRGYVVALHGIQSHPGWYDFSSRRICEAGLDLRYLDRRGAGLNQAERCHASHARRLIGDVTQILRDVRHERDRRDPSLPVMLMGVSWGGKLATAVAGTRPDLVDALILLYPGIRPLIKPTLWQDVKLRAAMMKGWVNARVPIPLSDPTLFTDDPDWQRFIAEDRLALHEATVGFLAASRELDRINNAAPRAIDCPALLMLAGRDRIIDNRATRTYFDRLASPTRDLIEYPEAAHTLEFERNREEFADSLIRWLQTTV